MGKSRFLLALKFGDYPLGQLLAQLNSPLVEGVDVPDRPLSEYVMLVKRN